MITIFLELIRNRVLCVQSFIFAFIQSHNPISQKSYNHFALDTFNPVTLEPFNHLTL